VKCKGVKGECVKGEVPFENDKHKEETGMKSKQEMCSLACAFIALVLGAGVVVVGPAYAGAADGFPNRPIRFISPFAAGGGNDAMSRLLTGAMAANMGAHIIVDNRPGANTQIGMNIVAKANPDGYTLVLTSSSLAINHWLYPKIPYSPQDFSPVSLVAVSPLIVVVNPAVPANSVKELIALAKAKPGHLLHASSGVGNISHLAGELFGVMTGAQLTNVSYKGSGPAHIDLFANRVQIMFTSALGMMPHVKSGKVRALAVTSSERSRGLPDVPTLAESGVPGYEASSWYGVLAPAKTPGPVLELLSAEIRKALVQPEVRDRIYAAGLIAGGNTPQVFARYIETDLVKWGKVIKASGIKLD